MEKSKKVGSLEKRIKSLEKAERECRKSESELRRSESRLNQIQQIARLGQWEFDFKNSTLTWSEGIYSIFNEDPKKFKVTYKSFLGLIHPEDRNFVDGSFTQSVMKKRQFNISFRLFLKDKSVKHVISICKNYYNDSGKPVRSLGTIQDITNLVKVREELKGSEENFRELFDNMSNGVCIYEVVESGKNFIFKDINKAGEEITNVTKSGILGKSIYEVRPNIEEFGLVDVFNRVWKTGKSEIHDEKFYQDKELTGYFKNFVYKLKSGEIVAIFEDITKQKKAEEEILRLKDGLEVQVVEKTKELNEKISDLERFFDATVDREFRMKELHNRIEELEKKLGE